MEDVHRYGILLGVYVRFIVTLSQRLKPCPNVKDGKYITWHIVPAKTICFPTMYNSSSRNGTVCTKNNVECEKHVFEI